MTDSIPSLVKGRRTIVMLDDEKGCREWVHAVISTVLQDFEFIEFTNGDEALEHLRANPPDLFITDVEHPGIDGQALLEKLAEWKASYPIIVFSATSHRDVNHRLHRLRLQGLKVNYWGKPCDVERMLYQLERIFRLPPQATPDTNGAKLIITPDQVLWMQDHLFPDGCSVLNHGVVLCGRLTAATFFTDSAMLKNNWQLFLEGINQYRVRYQDFEDYLLVAHLEVLGNRLPAFLKKIESDRAKLAPERHTLKLTEVPSDVLADYFRRLAVWSGDVWETLDWLAHQLPEDGSMPPPDKLRALEAELKGKYQQLRERQIKLAKELKGHCAISGLHPLSKIKISRKNKKIVTPRRKCF